MSTVRDLWVTRSGRRTPRYGRGLRWQAVWTDVNGKRRSLAVLSRRDAHEVAGLKDDEARAARRMWADFDAAEAVASERC